MPTQYADLGLIPADNPIPGMIDAAAERYGVDRNLAHVVAQMESNYNPRAVSGVGAQGVMQLMPETARSLGVKNPLDPAQNIDGGVKYLAQLSERYGGNTDSILAAYNAGPGAVEKFGGVPPYRETQNYVALGTKKLNQAQDGTQKYADLGLIPADQTPQPRSQPSVEVLPPLSEPPSEPKPPEKTFKGFLENVTTGVGRVLEPLTDPAGTLENVTNLIQGMSEKSGFAPVMGQPKQQMVDAIVNLYKHRYGSLEGFKNAWYDDPVGMAGDVAMVFSGAGLGVKAAQEFLEASGVAQHAATIADIFPKVAGTAETRVQAGINSAVDAFGKRYMEVLEGGIKQAPSGVLGGPHGMLGAAKYGAAKKAVEILKDGWKAGTEAYDARAGVSAAKTAEAATPAAAAPPAVAKTAGQAYAEAEGHDWASLSANDKQLMEQIAQAHANVAAQPPPPEPPPVAPAAPQAAPAAPEAPAATPEPPAAPVVPSAPQTQAPAASVEKLTDYVLSKKIRPHMVDKLSAEYWQMIADDAGVPLPTADEIAQIKANVEAKTVEKPVQGEQMFREKKAAAEEGMTAAKKTSGAPQTPLQKLGIPEHYQYLHDINPDTVGRAFEKDLRVADYVLTKKRPDGKVGYTPEEFEALPLAEQNKLILEAPAKSAKGKHQSYLPEPYPGAPRTVHRWAHEGIADTVNTMRWRQANPAPAPEAPAIPTPENTPAAAAASQEQVNALHAERIRHEAEMERRYGPGWRETKPATIPTEGIETPAQGKAAFETEQAKPAPKPAKRTRKPKS